jgi:flagellar protein FliL
MWFDIPLAEQYWNAMAKEPIPADQKPEASASTASQKATSFSMKKMLMFGVPIFLVQVVVIYFLVTKFIFPSGATQAAEKKAEPEVEKKEELVREVYVVGDLIVNPAGTNGTRFLLTTVGVEVDSPQTKTELEKKDIQVRDALISILTSKGLDQLGRIDQRDLLRSEIAQKIGDLLTSGKPKNVYFGKFIIQ